MLRKASVVALAAFAFSGAAQAQIAGPYIGVLATVDNINGSGDAEGFGATGAGASVVAGYNMVSNNLFGGLEANIDLNTADVGPVEARWGWGVGGRAGVLINDSTALYGRAGYQRTKVRADGLGSAWGDGVRFGGGVETGLSDRASIRVEFNHVNYEADLINNQIAAGVLFHF